MISVLIRRLRAIISKCIKSTTFKHNSKWCYCKLAHLRQEVVPIKKSTSSKVDSLFTLWSDYGFTLIFKPFGYQYTVSGLAKSFQQTW